MNTTAMLNTLSSGCRTLPVVIFYVTEGCNLRCLTCSYRNPLPGELSLPEIRALASSLRQFGLRRIVYSGGEPLMRRDFPDICAAFEGARVQQTLLTNGLLLRKRLPDVQQYLSEFIVSLDGPSAEVHDAIRGVESFEAILEGVRMAVRLQPGKSVAIRTVIQKRNFRCLAEMVRLALSLNVTRISFLAADLFSDSFGRAANGSAAPDSQIALSETETQELRNLVEEVKTEFPDEMKRGFISESYEKLLHIVRYFEAVAGKGPFPPNRCNAPMVSAVISSTGALHPCFFLPAHSSVRDGKLGELLNGAVIRQTRDDVRDLKPAACTTCVCTLYVPPLKALRGSF